MKFVGENDRCFCGFRCPPFWKAAIRLASSASLAEEVLLGMFGTCSGPARVRNGAIQWIAGDAGAVGLQEQQSRGGARKVATRKTIIHVRATAALNRDQNDITNVEWVGSVGASRSSALMLLNDQGTFEPDATRR